MRFIKVIITVAASAVACARPVAPSPARIAAATTIRGACAEPLGAAGDFRAYVAELVTSADSVTVDSRTKLGLPALREESEVAFETDAAVCEAAVNALAAAQQATSGTPTAAYVLRIGDAGYVAWNYEQVGEFFSYYVFDRQMKLISTFMS